MDLREVKNLATDYYFSARGERLDTIDRRTVYGSGFDAGYNAALSHGDGSKAEPVFYVSESDLARATNDLNMMCDITANAFHLNGTVPVYLHPTPTAQDSKVPEGWLNALSSVREYLVNSPASTGYCMCGSKVLTHGIGDGHAPVDEGDYHRDQVVGQIDSMLCAAPVPDKPQVPDEWHSAVVTLSNAEAHYRNTHDLYGDGDLKTGRAWDLLRRAGDKARKLLDTQRPAAPEGE